MLLDWFTGLNPLIAYSPEYFMWETKTTSTGSAHWNLSKETNKFSLSLELPGVKKEDFDISLNEELRQISLKYKKNKADCSYLINVPKTLLMSELVVEYDLGILTFTASKDSREELKNRKLKIQ